MSSAATTIAAEVAAGLLSQAMTRKRARGVEEIGDLGDEGGGWSGEGRFGGRLVRQRMRRVKPNKYDLYGSRGEDETFGTISRPEMAYIGMTSAKGCTFDTDAAGPTVSWSGSVKYHVAAALLRKILKRHWNVDITDHSQHVLVGTYQIDTYRQPSIYFIAKQKTLSSAQPGWYSYEINLGSAQDYSGLNPSGPKQFGFIAMEICKHVFSSVEFGGALGVASIDSYELYGYSIVDPRVFMGSTNWSQFSTGNVYRLDDEYVKCYSTAELMLQNITLSDATTDTSGVRLADRIDANPLVGRVFKFSTAFPQVREDGTRFLDTSFLAITNLEQNNYVEEEGAWRLMYDTNGDGVIVPGAALQHTWTQLPTPGMFYKCTGMGKVSMAPGAIQKMRLKFKFDGLLTNFIRGFRQKTQTSLARSPWDKNALGTSVLVALEKQMSTGTDTNVSVNYQISYWAGAVIKKSKKHPIRPYNKSCWMQPGTDATLQGTFVDNTYTGAVD